MEMVWAVLPALGLIALLFFTWKAVVASSAPAPSQSQTSVVLN
jgi:heme/copper-type cytochrome/quinol oxidase subunit 2